MSGLVVITGATGGIGAPLARRLSKEGWRVHLIDLNAADLEALAAELNQSSFAMSDLSTPEKCAVSLPADDITALVHLAGIFVPHEMNPEARSVFDDVLQHNASNAFDLVSAALPQMCEGGSIVLLSSMAFNRGAPEYAAYSMAKGAIVGLTRSLSRQVGERSIRVNALAPGIIETKMTEDLIASRGREKSLASIPLKRFGTPEDVVGPIAFLLSDDAAYVTGQVLNIDGGIVNG